MRAVSIVLVLVGHATGTVPLALKAGIAGLGWQIFGNSHLGVLTFFVISGYLITRLLRREYEKNVGISLKNFYKRRILRIFPAFYSYIAVVSVLVLLGAVQISGVRLISAMVFSVNYFHLLPLSDPTGNDYWFIGHFWTLSLEEQFYICWPALLVSLGFAKARRFALLMVVISPFLRIITYFLVPSTRPQIGMMLHTYSDPILLGSLVALMEGEERFEKLLSNIVKPLYCLFATILVLLISPLIAHRYAGAYLITAGITVDAICVALVMIYVTRSPDSLAGKFLNHPVVSFVGVLSYSLYMWQQLFLTSLNTTWTGRFPFNLVVVFGVATLSYFCIEKPFLNWKDRGGWGLKGK